METFSTDTYTIRDILKCDFDKVDSGKNYFIPPYQRKYDWTIDEVKKLIDDIFEQANKKRNATYYSYFIGGIVLSQQSVSGSDRSKKSLEVIDGQQRLTTIVLIVSAIFQILKFQKRHFTEKEKVSDMLKSDLIKLLRIKSLNFETMDIEEKLVLERSDNIADDFRKVINILTEEHISDIKQLSERLNDNDDSKKLIELTMQIINLIEIYDDNELLDFTMQLINNTWVVVTKTISIETGFFIFEKLNDSGIALEPQDLLKNYLFRTSTDKEYDELTKKWEDFLKKVKNINSSKAKILPRDFLEQYLTLSGRIIEDSDNKKIKKKKVFNELKEIHSDTFEKSMELLDNLMYIADEYHNLKINNNICQYLNAMNFKLGYLILLSFYKKYNITYLEYKEELLLLVVRLGFVYLITGQSKQLSDIIPSLCREIIKEGNTIEETIIAANSFVNSSLVKKKDILDEVISSTNLWRKKPLSRLLLTILEFHLSKTKIPLTFNLMQIMPSNYSESCKYQGISDDNYMKYSNYIGNFLIDINDTYIHNSDECFNVNSTRSDTLVINDLTKKIIIKNEEIIVTENTNNEPWGKECIINRSQEVAKLVNLIFLENNKFDKNFFKD